VQSYRDVYTEYREHPETKAAASTGAPVLPSTREPLAPAKITATAVDRIGKEADRLADDHLVDGDDDQPRALRRAHLPRMRCDRYRKTAVVLRRMPEVGSAPCSALISTAPETAAESRHEGSARPAVPERIR
jgi:hypothetical protein